MVSKCADNRTNAITAIDLRAHVAATVLGGLLSNPGGPIQANGMNGWGFCNCSQSDVIQESIEISDELIYSTENSEPKGGT